VGSLFYNLNKQTSAPGGQKKAGTLFSIPAFSIRVFGWFLFDDFLRFYLLSGDKERMIRLIKIT
jgi:hypothetical protein